MSSTGDFEFCFFRTRLGPTDLGAFFSPHRTQVKTEYLMSIENSDGLLEEIGAQALTTASYQLPDSVLQTIDAVALSDVVQVCAVLMTNELPGVS